MCGCRIDLTEYCVESHTVRSIQRTNPLDLLQLFTKNGNFSVTELFYDHANISVSFVLLNILLIFLCVVFFKQKE